MSAIDVDVVVIGAGVIGLACARALAQSGREVIVLESANRIASQTSSRNSEVIHAGLYYPTGSLKARFCVDGRRQLYQYLSDHKIDFTKCGKLIVASGDEELLKLRALEQRAKVNNVEGMRALTGAEAQDLEPALSDTVSGALLSEETGIFDSHAFYISLLGELEAADGHVALNSEVISGSAMPTYVDLEVEGSTTYRVRANTVINAAGLQAVSVARSIVGPHTKQLPQAHFAKGHYFSVSGKTPFQRLIYPMPNNAGLGIHLTLDLSGRGRLGPDVHWLEPTTDDSFDYAVSEARAHDFYKAASAYWPDLIQEQLQPDYAGIRPKLVDRESAPGDFQIQQSKGSRLINMLGIESPGLTASLPLANVVCNMISRDTSKR